MTDEDFVEIKILKKYYDEVEKIVANSSQFQTVSDYIIFY